MIYRSIYLSISHLSICLCILSIYILYLFLSLSIYPCIYLSIYPSNYHIYLHLSLSIYLSPTSSTLSMNTCNSEKTPGRGAVARRPRPAAAPWARPRGGRAMRPRGGRAQDKSKSHRYMPRVENHTAAFFCVLCAERFMLVFLTMNMSKTVSLARLHTNLLAVRRQNPHDRGLTWSASPRQDGTQNDARLHKTAE